MTGSAQNDTNSKTAPDTIHDDEAVAARLAALPHWHHIDGAIERSYRTANWQATMLVVSAIGHLCEAAWHHPTLAVSYGRVTVRLWTHSAKGSEGMGRGTSGITDKDFALAAKMEAVVAWRPGTEAGALDGPPTDPRFAYLRYD